MGVIARQVHERVGTQGLLWRLAEAYLKAKKIRDGAEGTLKTLRKEGLILLEKLDRDYIDYPTGRGSLRARRVEVVRAEWDVVGLWEHLRWCGDSEAMNAVFVKVVDEKALQTLIDRGLAEVEEVQRFARVARSYTFRAGVMVGDKTDES